MRIESLCYGDVDVDDDAKLSCKPHCFCWLVGHVKHIQHLQIPQYNLSRCSSCLGPAHTATTPCPLQATLPVIESTISTNTELRKQPKDRYRQRLHPCSRITVEEELHQAGLELGKAPWCTTAASMVSMIIVHTFHGVLDRLLGARLQLCPGSCEITNKNFSAFENCIYKKENIRQKLSKCLWHIDTDTRTTQYEHGDMAKMEKIWYYLPTFIFTVLGSFTILAMICSIYICFSDFIIMHAMTCSTYFARGWEKK